MPAKLLLPISNILSRYPRESAAAIGRTYKCSERPILRILNAAGVIVTPQAKAKQKALALPVAELTSRYLAGETMAALAKDFACAEWTIKHRLKRVGTTLRRTGPARAYYLNEDFFKRIRTESQAYWLGFILADGAVIHSAAGQYRMRCDLAIVDVAHLHKLAAAVATDAPVILSDDGTHAYLDLCSAKLCRDLIALECFPNKTGRHGTPVIPTRLLRHFYRGYTDGDGSLYPTPTTHSWRYDAIGAPKFIRQMQQWLMQNAALGKTKLVQQPPVCSVRYSGGRQVERIARLLYEDATVYLDRKYQAYLQLLSRCKKPGPKRRAA